MPRRILVADDSAVVRVAIGRRFRSAGLEIIEAASVAEAKAVDLTHIELAVLDFDLGDGFGDAIAEHLLEAKPGLPICFFTSSGEEARVKTATYGELFAKPDQADALVAWVLAKLPA